jgi:hypothetical protein
MGKTLVGIGKTKQKNWGPELQLSLSEDNLRELLGLCRNGWVNIDIKQRKTPDGEKTHYGSVWTPDGENGSGGNNTPAPPLEAPVAQPEDVPDPVDMTETMVDDDLPF